MIKKIAIFLFLIFSQKAFAMCDYSNFCPQSHSSTASNIMQFFSNVSGSTYLSEQFADNLIAQELQKHTGQNFSVDIKAYSTGELLNGKI